MACGRCGAQLGAMQEAAAAQLEPGTCGSAGGAQHAGPPGRRRLEERARFLVTVRLAHDSVSRATAATHEEG